MNAHCIETTVDSDGTVVLKDLPFQPGDRVEVIVIERPLSDNGQHRYTLRGLPLQYDAPFEPVT